MAIERGDIYLVELNPVQGRGQAGRRPVLVLSVKGEVALLSGSAMSAIVAARKLSLAKPRTQRSMVKENLAYMT